VLVLQASDSVVSVEDSSQIILECQNRIATIIRVVEEVKPQSVTMEGSADKRRARGGILCGQQQFGLVTLLKCKAILEVIGEPAH
jgi:hypothetical protein